MRVCFFISIALISFFFFFLPSLVILLLPANVLLTMTCAEEEAAAMTTSQLADITGCVRVADFGTARVLDISAGVNETAARLMQHDEMAGLIRLDGTKTHNSTRQAIGTPAYHLTSNLYTVVRKRVYVTAKNTTAMHTPPFLT
jgi:hypothetical protein